MAPAKPPSTLLGGTAIKPVERHGWEAIKYFFYNPDTGEVITRTPMSWLLITVFYVIYYSCLAAFWALCMFIFLQTLKCTPGEDTLGQCSEDHQYAYPRWQTDYSIIGKSPGLGLRPKQSEDLIDSALITFNTDDNQEGDKVENWKEWDKRIKEFLKGYEGADKKGVVCDEKSGQKADQNKACQVKLSDLGACYTTPGYGYKEGNPCIFLKLNKIFNLENEAVELNDTDTIPVNMPEEMKNHIKGQANKNQVWVQCKGKYPADKEALSGANTIKYFPKTQGFPNYYFPYTAQPDYLSPLIAVQFNVAKSIGQLIHIECRAFAKNIGYNRRDKIGISVFEIQVHDSTSVPKM